MKKFLIILVAVLGFATVASAQPKALGIRIGSGVDLSYENYAGGANFLEFEAGLDNYHANDFHLDGVYNFMIAEPDWTPGTWGFYAGPGASVAAWTDSDLDESRVYAGFLGNLGLEYTFNIPLQLSLDIRPRVMFGDGHVWTQGIFTFGFGARYAF